MEGNEPLGILDLPMRLLIGAVVIFSLIGGMAACSGDDDGAGEGDPVTLDSPDVVTFSAVDPGDQAAAIVSGDFNGDDVPDVALGAANADGPNNDAPDTGEVYLFFGPFEAGEALDGSEADLMLYGRAAGIGYGRTLAVGDFDGDGGDDLAITAPQANEAAGEIEILFGGEDGLDTQATAKLTGGDAGDYAGLMMVSADFDADQRDDLLIGALQADGPENIRPDGGEAYLVNGANMTPGSAVGIDEGGLISGAAAGDRLGETVAAGDVNGDGLQDIVVVSPFALEGVGETYVLFSPVALPIDMADAEADLTIVGLDPGDQLGHSIAVGDREGDGADDIVLGAVSADGPENTLDLAGEMILVDGSLRGRVETSSDGLPTVYGPEKEGRLGRYAAADDLDGDGASDVAVSAPNLAERAGIVYISYGGGEFLASTADADVTLTGLDPGDVLGTEVFGTPPFSFADLDGSGGTELLISAPQADGPDNARADAGEAYAVFFSTD